MRATEHLVVHDALVDVAGEELIALSSAPAIHDTGVAATLLTAPARRRQGKFVRPIRDGEQPGRAREEVEQEVGGETEGVDVDSEVIDDLGEGVDLFDARELRFIDHEDVDAVSTESCDVGREVAARNDRFGARFDTDPTRHHTGVAAVPEGPQGDVTSSLTQLPTELQGQR